MPGLARMKPTGSQPFLNREIEFKDEIKDEFYDDDSPESDDGTYRPRPQLSRPGVFMRSLGYLMKGLEDRYIDVDPEYQREVVWTADRMTGLVDSLMENYYIPPIILNKQAQPSGNGSTKYTLVCVDGKQRLSSVQAFIKGIIPCHDHRGDKWWFTVDARGSRRKNVLSEEVQKEFLTKEFVSFEFADLSQEQEEDLFARVQMGVQLTAAEKMRASTGPWQELARLFVEDYAVVFSLLKDLARAKDFQMALSCFSQIVEVQHPTAANGIPGLKTNYPVMPRLLENKGALDDGMKSHLAGVFNTFKNLIEEEPETFTKVEGRAKTVQTFAPIEMISVAVLISTYSETRNNRLLLGDIKALRTALRENFRDLRTNTAVWKFAWDFIDNLEAIRGAVDGTTVDRRVKARAVDAPSAQQAQVNPSPAEEAAAGKKRGRPSLRTKKTVVLPGASSRTGPTKTSVHIKTEDGLGTPPTDDRQPKRQRTDPGADPNLREVLLAEALSPYTSPIIGRPTPGPSNALREAVVKDPGPANLPTPTLKPFKATKLREDRQFFDTHAAPAPLITPPEARQNRISELDSYRSAAAKTGEMDSPFARVPQHGLAPTAQMLPRPLPQSHPVSDWIPNIAQASTRASSSKQPFTLNCSRQGNDEPQEVLRAVSPAERRPLLESRALPLRRTPTMRTLPDRGASASMTPIQKANSTSNSTPKPPTQKVSPPQTVTQNAIPSRPLQKARRTPAAPLSKAQYDGAIDLTSDTEQERQELLSFFRATAAAEHQPRTVTAGPAPGRPFVYNAQLVAGESPQEYNNPYLRRMAPFTM